MAVISGILIYPETAPQAGAGHLTRCVALAEELRARRGQVIFACRSANKQALDYLKMQGFEVLKLSSDRPGSQDLTELRGAFGGSIPVDWLVVDDYRVDAAWLSASRAFTAGVAVLDDLADRFLDCDLLLNQNLGFESAYEGLLPEGAHRLLGPTFALLRPEFADARSRGRRAHSGQVDRLLILFGGTDQNDNVSKAVRAVAKLRERKPRVDIVVGRHYQGGGRLNALLEEVDFEVVYHVDVPAARIVDLMISADLCVGAAGSTNWERCCLGLPGLLLVVADNQSLPAKELDRYGAALCLGWDVETRAQQIAEAIDGLMADGERLKEMSALGTALVDGSGASRVSDFLLTNVR